MYNSKDITHIVTSEDFKKLTEENAKLEAKIAKLQKVVDAAKEFEKNCYMRDCYLTAIEKMHQKGTYRLDKAVELQMKVCNGNCYYIKFDQALKELEG
jgi:hypothetical protein